MHRPLDFNEKCLLDSSCSFPLPDSLVRSQQCLLQKEVERDLVIVPSLAYPFGGY